MTQRGDGIRRFRSSPALFILGLLMMGGGCQDTMTGVPSPVAEPPSISERPQLAVAVTGVTWMGAGNIGNCSGTGDEATEALMDTVGGTVFTTGNSTLDGTTTSFTTCYDPSWGKLKARTRPAPGKKDYATASGAAYFSYYGASAGDADKGYYSYDTGDWHIVVLNTNLAYAAGSAQEQWLKADLAANSKMCQAAAWQLPRYYSYDGTTRSGLKAVWDDLYTAGVEVVVNSDWSWYERYAPQSPAGVVDSTFGIRQFIVGTGGQGTGTAGAAYANSEVRISGTLGVLRMTLGASAYDWKFVPVAGKTASDSGSYSCHGKPVPIARPGGPYAGGTATISVDGSASTDPLAQPPLSYAWDFGDGTTGTGAKTTHTYTKNDSYTISLVVTNAKGTASAPATTVATVNNLPNDPAESPVIVGAGNVASCSALNDEATGTLLDGIPGTVFMLGNQTLDGADSTITKCYGPSWGRHKDRTRPSAGKKDYLTGGGTPYYNYYGTNAGEPGKGYYSYDTGDWHVVVLNTNLPYAAGSAQEQWLKADLKASSKVCQAAMWQLPRYYSYDGSTRSSLRVIWELLYAGGVEVILNSDWGWYERFAPMNSSGALDQPNGIREFVVGTGGQGFNTIGTPYANSEARIASTFGVLRLKLNSASYSWQFVPIAGSTSTDIGTNSCHDRPPPTANPGGPYSSEGLVAFDGSRSVSPGNQPLTYAWEFGDGTSGTGVAPSHNYAASGTYTATLVVTNTLGVSSAPASTTVTINNLPPRIMMNNTAGLVGANVRVSPLFVDGAADGPWPYQMNWGDGATAGGTAVDLGSVPLAHSYAASGTYAATFTVTDSRGGSGSTSFQVEVAADATPAVVIAGAGDIASCNSSGDEATANLLDAITGTVFTVGDNVYEYGTAAEYTNCYAPSWGRHKARTRAALGNHEYSTVGTAAPTFDYFGPGVGVPGKGYYSYDIGNWHVVVLNSAIDRDRGSPQHNWLLSDLAASPASCTIAMWHHPRFSSGSEHGSNVDMQVFFQALQDAGAEIVLSGHDHDYERFAPQTASGVLDPTTGVREFIVGTGGASPSGFAAVAPNSEVRIGSRSGVLKLTLTDGTYSWQFLQTDGITGDSGSGTCH